MLGLELGLELGYGLKRISNPRTLTLRRAVIGPVVDAIMNVNCQVSIPALSVTDK